MSTGSNGSRHSNNPSSYDDTSAPLYHRFDDSSPLSGGSKSGMPSPHSSSRYITVPTPAAHQTQQQQRADASTGMRLGRSLSSGNAVSHSVHTTAQTPADHISEGHNVDHGYVNGSSGSGNGSGKSRRGGGTATAVRINTGHATAGRTGGRGRPQIRGGHTPSLNGVGATHIPRSTTTPPQSSNHSAPLVSSLVIPSPPVIAGTPGGASNSRSRAASRAAGMHAAGMGDSFTDYREETIIASNSHYHNRTVSAITTIASRIMFTGWYTALYLLMCLLCLFLLVWKLVNHLCIGDLPCFDEDEESDVYAALDIATTVMLLFEVSIRILATRKTFFKSWFNLFDFVVLLASIGSFVLYVTGVRFGDSITKSIILFVRYSIQLCRLILVFKRHRDRIRIMSLASHAPVDFTAYPSDMVVDTTVTYDDNDNTIGAISTDVYIGTGSPITAALLAQGRTPPPALLYGRPHQRNHDADDDDDDSHHNNNDDMPDPPPKRVVARTGSGQSPVVHVS